MHGAFHNSPGLASAPIESLRDTGCHRRQKRTLGRRALIGRHHYRIGRRRLHPISAALLRSQGERVAILDWDAHHGNGTQSMLGDDPGVLYVSIHQDPFYPFDGHIQDIDAGEAKGTTINIPVPAGTAGDVYRRAWGELVIPAVKQFEPDWVLISAGFDAHVDDSLAELQLRSSDFGWLTAAVAEIHPVNRVVATLEGGYDLEALQRSTVAMLRGLAGIAPMSDETGVSPAAAGRAVDKAAREIARHWKV